MTDIVAELRARRIALGLSQAEVARRAGWKRSQLCDYEKARVSPTIDSAGRWARALGLLLTVQPIPS